MMLTILASPVLAVAIEPEFDIAIAFVPESEFVENSFVTHTAYVTVVCTEYSPRMQTGNMVFTPYVYVNEGPEELDVRHTVGKLSFVFQYSDCENRVEKEDFFNVSVKPRSARGLAPVSLTIGLVADQGTGNGSTEWETRTAIVGDIDIWRPMIHSRMEARIEDEMKVLNRANVDIIVEVSENSTMDSPFEMEPVRFGPIFQHRGNDSGDVPLHLTVPREVRENDGEYPLFLDVRIEAVDPAGYHIETQTVATDVRIRHYSGPDPRESGSEGQIGWFLLGGLLLIAGRSRRRS